MAIDKAIEPIISELEQLGVSPEEIAQEVTLAEQEADGESLLVEMEDCGMMVDFDPMADMMTQEDSFDSNLADFMDEGELQHLGSELVGKFESDRSSRGDWEQSYEQGLDQLGLEIEERTTPMGWSMWRISSNAF